MSAITGPTGPPETREAPGASVLSPEAREYIRSQAKEQIARQPPASAEYIEEVAAIIATIRIRWAREAAAARRAAARGDHDAG
jgi:hypothetical protein